MPFLMYMMLLNKVSRNNFLYVIEIESDEDTAGLEPATIVPLPIVTKAPKEPFPEDFPDDIDDLPDYPEDMPAISEPRKHYHVPPLPLSSPPPQPATQQPPKPSPQPQLMHLIKPPVPTLIKPQLEATVGDSPSTQIESDVEIEEWSDVEIPGFLHSFCLYLGTTR